MPIHLWSGLICVAILFAVPEARSEESVCFGTASNGRLEGGVRIRGSGPNFGPYSSAGVLIGRTDVHSRVAAIIEAAYESLWSSAPSKTYLYGESGWRTGGRIQPHKTHQNGLAVDFMVPVVNTTGKSIPLPTSVTNKFGYSLEFDSDAKLENLTVDFEAMAEHLYALKKAAETKGVGISRVIFDKAYIQKLYKTKRGTFIREHVPFMRGTPWIRHDEHYHVDFEIACKPL